MVTNGGYNGVNAALANGVPVVVAPGSVEKAEVAERVQWTGAGLTVPRRRMSEAAIRTAVRMLLRDPQYRRGAQFIRDQQLQREPAADATDLIERLVAAGPSAVLTT
jgi:UDP:flavonoid glycosyltransferase YjiC (YdhE family)